MSQTNWEADKMLDVYIHDYLVKRDLKASAQAFQSEAKVSSDPVAIDAPGGFLFEWWSVFWDIFIARTNEKHSEVAASYIETQMLKSREQQQQQLPSQQQPPPHHHQQQQQQHQQQQHLHMQQLLLQRQAQQQQQQQVQNHQQQQQLQNHQQQFQNHQQQLQNHQQQQHQHLQQQSQQPQTPQHPQQQQSLQQQSQQQRRDGAQILNGTTNAMGGSEQLSRQNPGTANALATKMYEERLKVPLQRDSLDETSVKQRFGDNVGQLLDPSQTSTMKSAAAAAQSSGQILHGTAGCMSPQIQARNQQVPDIKTDMNPMLNPRGAGPEGSLIGIPGTNQNSNNLTLKGWPLTGLDQLRSGLLQQQKSFIQASQPYPQLQMLTPQHQQQLLLAQQSLTSASANDLDNRRLRMLLNSKIMGLGKDGLSNSVGDMGPNVGSPLQAGCPVLPRADADMLIKLKMAHLQQQQQQQQQQSHQQQPHQQLQQNALSCPQSQVSNHSLHQNDKIGPANSITMDGSISNSFRPNDQFSAPDTDLYKRKASKSQTGRKRKQPVSSSGPANSSGTANTAGPSTPSTHTAGDVMSLPSTPSTNHTPGDVISSLPALAHGNASAKPMLMFGADTTASLGTTSNQLADIERFVEDGSLDDNVESFLSHDDTDPRDSGRGIDISKGFTFAEVNSVRASTGKVVCCHFSSDGKILASGGHDKKVMLWYADTLKPKTTLEEHSSLITDVRFSPSMSRLATSSFDKSVRVWDAENAGYSLRNFTGHSASVMSLDFHPIKEDLICSCDGDGEIRYWSINNGNSVRVFKGGTTQMRFQPRHGKYLAAAAENVISILDVETQACQHRLQGHTKPIHSVCWDPSGEFLASVSEDCVRVWTLGPGNEGECVHELSCNGNKFYSCAFHPTYSSLLVIGCYQSLELWNMNENKTMALSAHDGLIAALAVSTATGLVASASHDKSVKLWK